MICSYPRILQNLSEAVAPHPPAGTVSPLAGRREYAAPFSSTANPAQGTSPLPVQTGGGLG
ncbi:hypothetical protein CHY08_29685 (plasmid) [Rhizobium leguminosarum bv. viciae]|nr:hypothetical protein CHY08_29685 [Rhizobium leguminosarum bv. viciae]